MELITVILFNSETQNILNFTFLPTALLNSNKDNLTSKLWVRSKKLRKTTISFVMSVCPPFRPYGITWLPLEGVS